MTRVTAILAMVALFIPAGLSAQRLPLPKIGRRGPAQPAPLPPEIEPVARSLAYKRMRLSVESYPLINYVRSPAGVGGSGPIADWTSFGTGTRADYRISRFVALTFDLTSSFAGGPADVHTAEVGIRLRRERSERTLYTFADFRVGYVASQNSFDAIGEQYYPTSEPGGTFRYGDGYGALGGVGLEYALTRSFSLTTAASVMRNRMTTQSFLGAQPDERSYTMTLYRYTLGLRYNPVRMIRVPGTDLR